MEKIALIEEKINQVALELGFREFNFGSEKLDTAQRALSRFVKAMTNKINRDEMDGSTQARLKLDLVSNLIKKLNNAKFVAQTTEKVDFILENDTESMFNYHKNRLVKYFSAKLSKELKFNYTILKNYYAFGAYVEQNEAAKKSLEDLRLANKDVFDKIKVFEKTTLDNLEESVILKSELSSQIPALFNIKLLEDALAICKLNKDKIDEINKTYLAVKPKQFAKKATSNKEKARKTIDMSKVKTNTVKTAYTDKGAENNPFASLLEDLKK